MIDANNLNEENNLDEDLDDHTGNVEQGSDDYGKSGEKYGWYNGFSDDAIDDAFEGDPENTWNVD